MNLLKTLLIICLENLGLTDSCTVRSTSLIAQTASNIIGATEKRSGSVKKHSTSEMKKRPLTCHRN